MKFPNESKSLLAISKETLIALCVQFGKDPRKLPRRGELDETNFPLYMADITEFRPCSICNGPRGIVKLGESSLREVLFMGRMWESQTLAIYSPIRCLNYPVHSIIESSRDPLSNWNRIARPEDLCEHGYYRVECGECKEKLKEVLYGTQIPVV